jgi:two-component system response regulator FixJ
MGIQSSEINQTRGNLPGRVYLIDDKISLQPSLARRLERLNYQIIRFESTHSFLFSSSEMTHGVIVLGPGIDIATGMQLQKQLLARISDFPIIFIAHGATTPQIVTAMRSGAANFLSTPVIAEEIDQAIKDAMKRSYKSAPLAQTIETCQARYACLTTREQQVMKRVVSGMSNKYIASELCLSARTVEVHRSNVMKKMQARSLPELVRMADICKQSDEFQ